MKIPYFQQGNLSLLIIFLDSTRGDLSYSDSPVVFLFFFLFSSQSMVRQRTELSLQNKPVPANVTP